MEAVLGIIAYIAAIGVWVIYWPYVRPKSYFIDNVKVPVAPFVSIIIPARNEEQAIGRVIRSLLKLQYPRYEIIVVDDGSTDKTGAIARQYPVKVITAPPKPAHWVGKNWACHVGSLHASGSYFLFTDADTLHAEDSLSRAVNFLIDKNADMISIIGYHCNRYAWEKMLGSFYCLIFAGITPDQQPSPNKPYALGQYLLFEKSFYEKLGGHYAVRQNIAEDVALAKLTMQSGKYLMYHGAPLCAVQMYHSLSGFSAGWLRLMRIGISQLKLRNLMFSLVPLLSLNAFNIVNGVEVSTFIPMISTIACFGLVQPSFGRFHWSTIFLFPAGVIVFLLLSISACICQVLRVPISWRGRVYQVQAKQEVAETSSIL